MRTSREIANLEQPMHKSKLSGFIIDCETLDLDGSASFWGNALGLPVRALPGREGETYKQLLDHQHGLHIEVQAVSHPSRVHLDIESSDVGAEVQRLEKLGAKRIQAIQTWWVMEAPTGQRFCVVQASSEDFDTKASAWR
jgi:hypothetical protein